jgi:uncharacterized membrane protein YhaH (DUF805 family)
MNWYVEVLKKYAVFVGRAGRPEYWYFVLFNFIISVVLGFIDGVIGSSGAGMGVGVLGSLYALAVLVPSIAVSIRRLHDTGRSGWWLLISLVPFVGFVILLVFMVLESDAGENQYGSSPAAIAA